MDSSLAHGVVLRTPWYACERSGTDRFDPIATRPVIQKYDAPDFAKRLVKGRFGAPWDREGDGAIRWTTTELALFLDGSALITKRDVSPRVWDPKERRVVFQ